MQVNQITNPGQVVRNAEAAAPARVPTRTGDQAEFSASEALNRALDDSPPVRGEEVARGQALAQNVQYPPTELIQRISRLLANNWTSSE